jgi:hypothetical protein
MAVFYHEACAKVKVLFFSRIMRAYAPAREDTMSRKAVFEDAKKANSALFGT